MNARSKTTAVPKLSYLHVSKLKKRSRNRENLFHFWNLVSLKGFTFHLNDKKISDIGTLKSTFYLSFNIVQFGAQLSKKKTILVVNSVKSDSWKSSANDVALNCLNWLPLNKSCLFSQLTCVI